MQGIVVQFVSWLVIIFFGSQVLILIGLFLWMIWMNAIKPRLIPASHIEGEADEIIANYPDPAKEAFARHEHAWHHGDRAEQAYWGRVRKAVRQRLLANVS